VTRGVAPGLYWGLRPQTQYRLMLPHSPSPPPKNTGSTPHGDREVSSLCKDLGFKAVDILFEYSEYKKKGIMKSKIALLHRLRTFFP